MPGAPWLTTSELLRCAMHLLRLAPPAASARRGPSQKPALRHVPATIEARPPPPPPAASRPGPGPGAAAPPATLSAAR